MKRQACMSPCGTYRYVLVREWDTRPCLLVVMFNPARADDEVDDQTIKLLCFIASFNGYGAIRVVNLCPLRCSKPGPAIEMVNTWDVREAWDERDVLLSNDQAIREEVEKAGAVLFAWGALAARIDDHALSVIDMIEEIVEDKPVFCLGRTKDGYPLHPMARGKRKLPKNAPLLPWREPA